MAEDVAVLRLMLTANYVGRSAFGEMSRDLAGLTAQTNGLTRLGSAFKVVGDAMILAGAAAAVGLGAAVKVAAEYDQAIQRIVAVMPNHLSAQADAAQAVDTHTAALMRQVTQVQALKNEIAAAAVSMGQDPTQIATGAYYLFSSLGALGLANTKGINTFLGQNIVGMLAQYARASGPENAGGVSFAQAAQDLPRLFTAYGMPIQSWGQGMGVFTYLENQAHLTQSQLVQSMSKFTPAATAAGISFPQAALLMAAMASSGVAGSRAGTEASTGLITLLGGPKAQAELAKLGLSNANFFDKGGAPLPMYETLSLIAEKMQGMSPADRLAAEHDLFGLVGFRAYGGLLNTGLGKYDNLIQGAGASGIMSSPKQAEAYMQMIALGQMQGPAAQFQSLAAAAKLFGIAVGEAVMPEVLKLVDHLKNFLVVATQFVNDLKNGTSTLHGFAGALEHIALALSHINIGGHQLGIGGLFAAAPLALMGGGLGMRGLGSFLQFAGKGGLSGIGTALFGGGGAEALAFASKNGDWLNKTALYNQSFDKALFAPHAQYARDMANIDNLFNTKRAAYGPGGFTLTAKRDAALTMQQQAMRDAAAAKRDAALLAGPDFAKVAPLKPIEEASRGLIPTLYKTGSDAGKFLINGFKAINWGDLANFFVLGFQMVMSHIGLAIERGINAAALIFRNLPGLALAGLKALPGAVVDLFKSIPGGIANLFSGALGVIKSLVTGGFSLLLTGAQNLIPMLLGVGAALLPILAVAALVGGAIAILVLIFTNFRTQADQVGKMVGSTLGPIFQQMGQTVKQVAQAIGQAWDAAWPAIKTAMQGFMDALLKAQPVVQVFGTVVQFIFNVIATAVRIFGQVFIAVLPTIIGFFTGIVKVVTDVAKLVMAVIHGDWGKIPGLFLQLLLDIVVTIGKGLLGIIGLFAGLMGKILQGIKDHAGQVFDWFKGLPGSILGLLAGLAQGLLRMAGQWIQGMANGVINGIGNVLGAIGTLKDNIGKAFDGLSTFVQQKISNIPLLGGVIMKQGGGGLLTGGISINNLLPPGMRHARGGLVGYPPSYYASGGIIPEGGRPVVVGEKGWEFAVAPTGTHIFSHSESMTMLHNAQLGLAGGNPLGRPLAVSSLHVDTLHLPADAFNQLAERLGAGQQRPTAETYQQLRAIQAQREAATGGYDRRSPFDDSYRYAAQWTR